ncbi:hypothetical protein [Sphingobacterium hotanense]|uniref:hypothetical protein n=1 Tax=Sphingobacterium hotanense TaxID=649196 RepID=UPI0011F284D9|nr:hypothetical protein [Sphingobacterium hotanense]
MKYQVTFFLCFMFMIPLSYAQTNSFSTIKEAVNYHINRLKEDVRNYDNIFVITGLSEDVDLSERVYQVENGFNASFLKKDDTNYLVRIIIDLKSEVLKVDMINFRVIKKSRKAIHLINLSNGGTYFIKP